MSAPADDTASRFIELTREEWARLRESTPLTLDDADLAHLQGLNERVSLREVVDVYLPLSRLLNLHVSAAQSLAQVAERFLGQNRRRVPFVIAIAGSVAVGKSTTARILRALLARWSDHPKVDLVTTDGFLFPNETLRARGLMDRKGFPESYDQRRLLGFLIDLKSGNPVSAPVYSHLSYDIVPGQFLVVDRPDIVIVEGLNVLQSSRGATVFVSDFFDFSIYIDAEDDAIERWYVERFLALRETVFQNRGSYFHKFAQLTVEESREVAAKIWREINGVNLRDNIKPTRGRAHLILEKGSDHAIERVRLRKM